jgi:hypothetical protein
MEEFFWPDRNLPSFDRIDELGRRCNFVIGFLENSLRNGASAKEVRMAIDELRGATRYGIAP